MYNYCYYNSEEYNLWSCIFFDKINKYNINSRFLSSNKNINENTVIHNLDYKWDLINLSKNPSISFDFLENLIKKDKINYDEIDLHSYYNNICKNPTYTLENAINEKNNIINSYTYSLNPCVTWNDIINNKNFPWDFHYLSRNRNISFQNVIDNSNQNINYSEVIKNSNNNLYFDWDYSEIIKNPIFNIKDIDKIPKLKKYKLEYFENPNFDLYEYIKIFPIKDSSEISRSIYRNENFSIKLLEDLIKLFPDFEIEYDLLGDKKNIDFDFIFSNNYNWDFHYISQNPNLTFDIIYNNDYNWDFTYMSLNTFDKERKLFLYKF